MLTPERIAQYKAARSREVPDQRYRVRLNRQGQRERSTARQSWREPYGNTAAHALGLWLKDDRYQPPVQYPAVPHYAYDWQDGKRGEEATLEVGPFRVRVALEYDEYADFAEEFGRSYREWPSYTYTTKEGQKKTHYAKERDVLLIDLHQRDEREGIYQYYWHYTPGSVTDDWKSYRRTMSRHAAYTLARSHAVGYRAHYLEAADRYRSTWQCYLLHITVVHKELPQLELVDDYTGGWWIESFSGQEQRDIEAEIDSQVADALERAPKEFSEQYHQMQLAAGQLELFQEESHA